MGTTKTSVFNKRQNELAVQLKAIAHPARIAIIEFLIKKNSCICSDIVQEINLAQPTISQHLKELKHAGWIKGEIEGNAICYCLNEATLQKMEDYFLFLKMKVAKANTSCC